MEEIWKNLNKFEDKYKVSSNGEIINKYNNAKLKKQISKDGYEYVTLYYNKKTYKKTVHRLVAETFVQRNKTDNLEVNHIDGNKLNNTVSNLEWVTHKENINHAWKNKLFEPVRQASRRYGKDNPAAKKIVQYSLKGQKIKEYESIADAVRETKIHKTSIGKCCHGRQKTAGNYIWKFKK